MLIKKFGDEVRVKLTESEESSLAKCVMRALASPKLTGDRYHHMRYSVYGKKCQGLDLTANDLYELVDIFDHYGFDLPELTDDNKFMLISKKTNEGTEIPYENYIMRIRIMILMIWKDAWDEYRDDLVKIADEFKKFGGERYLKDLNRQLHPESDEEKFLRAEEYEAEFFAEVDKVQAEFGCARDEAIIMVQDYKPRGSDV